MTVVHVVMGNDYPAAVFSSPERAEAYCRAKREKADREGMVYWRTYEFPVDKEEVM